MESSEKHNIINRLDELHTTKLGAQRIRENINFPVGDDLIANCRQIIVDSEKVIQRGKNYYVYYGNVVLTVNVRTMTIITAHEVDE